VGFLEGADRLANLTIARTRREAFPPRAASGSWPAQYNRIQLARDELPIIQVRQQLAVLDDHLAAQYCRRRPPFDLPSFPWAVVAHVKVLACQLLLDRWVEEHDVGVAARCDYPLARIEAKDARRIGRDHVSEALQSHPALHHALGVDNTHPRLGSQVSAGNVVYSFTR
jgi:hypothetical protein